MPKVLIADKLSPAAVAIFKERGVDAKWAASISGYWRRGRTEETFRQWKRELAEAESSA